MRVLLSLLFASCIAPDLAAQAIDAGKAAAVVQTAHARGDFDGVVVISQHGKVVYQAAVGEADHASHRVITVQSRFRLASLTKQVTSLLIMQQVEAGKLRLDEKAGDVLPALSPDAARVTVQQLLQHISGLPNPSNGWSEDKVPQFYLTRNVGPGYISSTATGFCSGKAVRPPDEKFEYNNCDYIVLGALLERVTGMHYADLLRSKITGPLGLASWGIFANGNAPATVKSYDGKGREDPPQNPATYASAGALYGNALDVAKWDAALLTNRLLPASATATMFKGENNLGGEALGSWSYDLPGTSPAVHLVERQGDIASTRVLNLLLPQFDSSIVIVANTERADLFNTYSKTGLGFDLVKAITGR